MTDETVVDVLEVAEKVLVEVSERVKVRDIRLAEDLDLT